MSEENNAPKVESKPPTPEELEKRSKELMAFYKKELPLLRLRSEYEELITKINVSKMQRLEIMIAKAEMMEGQKHAQQVPQQGAPQGQQEPEEHVRPANPDRVPVNSKKEDNKAKLRQKPKGNRTLKKVK